MCSFDNSEWETKIYKKNFFSSLENFFAILFSLLLDSEQKWSQKICVTDFYYGSQRMCVSFLNFDSLALYKMVLWREKEQKKNFFHAFTSPHRKEKKSSLPMTSHSLNSYTDLLWIEKKEEFFNIFLKRYHIQQQREATKTIWLTDSDIVMQTEHRLWDMGVTL